MIEDERKQNLRAEARSKQEILELRKQVLAKKLDQIRRTPELANVATFMNVVKTLENEIAKSEEELTEAELKMNNSQTIQIA